MRIVAPPSHQAGIRDDDLVETIEPLAPESRSPGGVQGIDRFVFVFQPLTFFLTQISHIRLICLDTF